MIRKGDVQVANLIGNVVYITCGFTSTVKRNEKPELSHVIIILVIDGFGIVEVDLV